MKIAIFGSGPSGLVAAHAALLQGISFDKIDIFSHGKKSRLFGCQYLHAPIDGLPMSDPVTVKYRLEGSPEMYQRKVYGEEKIPRQVSPEELGNEHKAWDIRAAYDYLWTIWGSCIKKAIIASHEIHTPEFKEFLQGYDVIISTIPKTEWCIDPRHDFKTSEIWAIGDAPELGIMVPQRPAEHNMVICNGLHDVGWYRLSNVFGYNTMEWPGRRKPPVEGAVAWRKPISNTCDCWYDLGKIEFIGRYGEWQKGVKVHDVFRRAKRLFTDIQA